MYDIVKNNKRSEPTYILIPNVNIQTPSNLFC